MKSAARTSLLFALAVLAGLTTGELLYRAPVSRRLLARSFGLEGQMSPLRQHLREAARAEPVSEQAIARSLELLRDQFSEENLFTHALASTNWSLGDLRARVAEHLRELVWIEEQIAPDLPVTADEERAFYETHLAQFQQPRRFRVSHIFLAAPEGTPAEVILAKQSAIQGLAIRLLAGESFPQLASEASEDERTKLRGGDLGYFAATRMPPEFIAEVEKLKPGQTSGPFRSHLGFHLLQLTEVKPARQMTLSEAQPEIQVSLGNAHRQRAIARLEERLAAAR